MRRQTRCWLQLDGLERGFVKRWDVQISLPLFLFHNICGYTHVRGRKVHSLHVKLRAYAEGIDGKVF